MSERASRKRGARVPCRGGLWPSFFSKVIHCDEYFHAWPIKAVKIPIIPDNRALPLLDAREQARIVSEFQPRLLGYRFANFGKLPVFDNSTPDHAARRTVNVLVASALDSADLQAEIIELVADEVAESREERWTDPTVVLIEALLLYSHPAEEVTPYVGEVTDAMKTIFSARGEERKLKPNQVSRMIRHLGFKLEPRVSAGVKLRITDAIRRRVHDMALEFAAPSIENQVAGCSHCAAIAKRKESASTDCDPGTPPSI